LLSNNDQLLSALEMPGSASEEKPGNCIISPQPWVKQSTGQNLEAGIAD